MLILQNLAVIIVACNTITRVLYREGLHILMNTRLIKLILAKQVVETKNTSNYLKTGHNGVAITRRHQESMKLRNSRPVKLHKKAAHMTPNT
jgi:predicted transcriptional regulator